MYTLTLTRAQLELVKQLTEKAAVQRDSARAFADLCDAVDVLLEQKPPLPAGPPNA
jgi:hypothetical protein